MIEKVTTFIPGHLYSDLPLNGSNRDPIILKYVGLDDMGGPTFTHHSGPEDFYIVEDDGTILFMPGEDFYPVDEKELVSEN